MASTGTSSPMREIKPSICPIKGDILFCHQITESSKTDRVRMTMPPELHVLPVIVVPGVMGSNLAKENGEPIWLVDSGPGVAWKVGNLTAGERQQALHPGRTQVYKNGGLPLMGLGALTRAQLKARGWGEVSASFYQDFLIWLEENLNGGGTQSNHSKLNTVLQKVQEGRTWNATKTYSPLTAEESKKAVQWTYPTHAFGYNWMDDIAQSAKYLGEKITALIDFYNQNGVCKQVILVTHSMGGLVARYCSEVDNTKLKHTAKREKIAGIVHGVMPTVGAAVAYRRCKVGMWDEDRKTSIAIGTNGREVTAVFAQSPGTLQLLPSKQYPVQDWLQVTDSEGSLLPDQPKTDDPYKNIYKVKDKWWGLINAAWLSPKDGPGFDWTDYLLAIGKAEDFHDAVADKYHANTYGFYGSALADPKTQRAIPNSFARVTWVMGHSVLTPHLTATAGRQIMSMQRDTVSESGSNQVEVNMPSGPMIQNTGPYYFLQLDDARDSGDETVPIESGRLPVQSASVKQFFNLPGVKHGDAYSNENLRCRQIAAYAIGKIAAGLPLPTKDKA